jgi:hypothetical protein
LHSCLCRLPWERLEAAPPALLLVLLLVLVLVLVLVLLLLIAAAMATQPRQKVCGPASATSSPATSR